MTVQEQKYKEIITKVSQELNLPYKVVDRAYKCFWRFVRTSIESLPLKQGLTEEEFKQLRTSINIPSLGKFSCTYDRYLGIRQRFEYIKNLKEYVEDKES